MSFVAEKLESEGLTGSLLSRRRDFKTSLQNIVIKCLQSQTKLNMIQNKEAILWKIYPLHMQELW